jgi:ABC-type transport system involved in Fe-S cluster assembly fused permease/ATPase subunit
MQSAMTAAERVFQLLDTPVEIASPPVPRIPAPESPERGAVSFENVWFAYKRDEFVLRDLNLTVRPGEMVAIVGATGSGKTTTIKLLNRFYDVVRGSVRVSGIDVREWDLPSLRREVGVVLQDVFLFSGSMGRRRRRTSTGCSILCRDAGRSRSASGATTSRQASDSCSRSRACSPSIHASWCSTRPRRASIPRPSR